MRIIRTRDKKPDFASLMIYNTHQSKEKQNMPAKIKFCFLIFIITTAFMFSSYQKNSNDIESLAEFPLNNIEGVITRDGVAFDETTSADGAGSLKITVSGDRIIQLFETGNLDAEDCVLYYSVKIKTENLAGQAYLLMWCNFAGKGEYFSKGLDTMKSGNMNWSTAQTVFFLKKGENPDNIRLQLVVTGTGYVWIDDIKLFKVANNKQ